MQWPPVAELRDITVTPLIGPSSKGRLKVAADPPSPELRHFREGSRVSALKIAPLPKSTVATRVIEEPVIYGGLLFRHFGHTLTESIHRLWPRYALKELHRAKVAFNLVNDTKIMPYITEALNFHGFSKSDVIAISEPILFRHLFVGRQARTLAGPTTFPGYQSMLDRDLSRRLPPPTKERKLYVSRLRHHHTGSYYGESFVERALVKEGFEIVYPEQHSLTDMVTMLRSAEIAIFAEGSAIHALELCGSHVPAVAIISRRPETAWRFTPLLSDICDKWLIADHLLATAGMGPDAKKYSGILDLPALLRDLQAFAGLSDGFGAVTGELKEAIRQDVDRHIQDTDQASEPDHGQRAEELRRRVQSFVDVTI